jgi:Na+/glutamate symporter
MKLSLIETVAFAGIALYIGAGVRRLIPVLSRYNIPDPVVGGLLVAISLAIARSAGYTPLAFDTTLQSPLMIAFFASIGFAASLSLLRLGGPQVAIFFVAVTLLTIVQNTVGVLLSYPLGVPPLFGVLAGSVTMAGGPATGLAVALPLLILAAVQVMLTAAVCFWPMFRLMGRDYDAAVMSAGLGGFMLGTTANAVANMGAMVQKYGPAPRAFLVVPMVGAFFIDFSNAMVITVFLNLLK